MPAVTQVLVEASPDLLDTFVFSTALYERIRAFDSKPADWKNRIERHLERGNSASKGQNLHQTDLFNQYSKVLQTISHKAPLVLFVDDLQWADLGTASLLFHLGRHLIGTRILIVGAYRPEEVALGRDRERHPLEQVVNELQRAFGKFEINLDQAEGRSYIDAMLDSEPNRLDEQFRAMLFLQTRGHPLFTVELLRGMKERGDMIMDEEGCWVEESHLNWEKLPARVEAVIAERFKRLDSALQSILRTASVEGELFTAEVVAQVQNRPNSEIFNDLSIELDRKHRLVRAQSIQRVGGQILSSYRFRHILVQKYIYSSLDEAERVHLHKQIGSTLESMYEPQPGAGAISLQLARHFEQARSIRKAVHYLLESGARAQLVSAYQEAILHLKKGLALITGLPDSDANAGLELSFLTGLSSALHLAKGLVDFEAERTAIQAYQICQQIGTPAQMGQILGTLSLYAYIKGEYQTAFNYALKLLELGRESENPLLEGTGHWCMGIVSFGIGALLESRRHLEQVVSVYDPHQHHQSFVLLQGVDTGLSAMAYLSCCLWCLGYPDQAQAMSAKTLALASEIGHAFTLADVLRYGCCELHFHRRDAKSLEMYANALTRLSQEKKYPAWLAAGKYCLGEAYLLADRIPEGIALLREGVQEDLRTGVQVSVPGPLCFLAEVYAGLEEVDQGLKVWNESMQLITRTGERLWEAEHYRVLALLQNTQGKELAAESNLEKAIEIAHQQGARSWELRAAVSLAKMWRKQDRLAEGRQLLQKVLAGFTEGFDTPELKEAVELFDE
jgi:adenylate cyclase